MPVSSVRPELAYLARQADSAQLIGNYESWLRRPDLNETEKGIVYNHLFWCLAQKSGAGSAALATFRNQYIDWLLEGADEQSSGQRLDLAASFLTSEIQSLQPSTQAKGSRAPSLLWTQCDQLFSKLTHHRIHSDAAARFEVNYGGLAARDKHNDVAQTVLAQYLADFQNDREVVLAKVNLNVAKYGSEDLIPDGTWQEILSWGQGKPYFDIALNHYEAVLFARHNPAANEILRRLIEQNHRSASSGNIQISREDCAAQFEYALTLENEGHRNEARSRTLPLLDQEQCKEGFVYYNGWLNAHPAKTDSLFPILGGATALTILVLVVSQVLKKRTGRGGH